MKSVCLAIVAILMVVAMAVLTSSQLSAKDDPAANSATTAKSAAPSVAAPSVNPPHGQPGHVCTPPTGASTVTSGTTVTSSTIKPLSMPGSTTKTVINPTTAAGMNPPHGQPNHRCDIGVGVGLDSPAGTGKSKTPANPQVSTTIKSTSTPATSASAPTTAIPTAPGMNPPHGQLNHRCDIGVGLPLDSPAGAGKAPTSQSTAPSISTPPIKIVPSTK